MIKTISEIKSFGDAEDMDQCALEGAGLQDNIKTQVVVVSFQFKDRGEVTNKHQRIFKGDSTIKALVLTLIIRSWGCPLMNFWVSGELR